MGLAFSCGKIFKFNSPKTSAFLDKWGDKARNWAFILACVLFVFTTFSVAPFIKYREVNADNARLKKSVSDATSKPMRVEIDRLRELEAELRLLRSGLPERSVSKDRRGEILTILGLAPKIEVQIGSQSGAEEASRLVKQFSDLFREAGIPHKTNIFVPIGIHVHGIQIRSSAAESSQKMANALKTLMEWSYLRYEAIQDARTNEIVSLSIHKEP